MDHLTDSAFIEYCDERVTSQDVCTFVTTELSRLCRLAGMPDVAQMWAIAEEMFPGKRIECDTPGKIRLVTQAVHDARLKLPN